jgi:hypothetical protein
MTPPHLVDGAWRANAGNSGQGITESEMLLSKWIKLLGFLGCLGLALSAAGCGCLDNGEDCGENDDCCSDYCNADDICEDA